MKRQLLTVLLVASMVTFAFAGVSHATVSSQVAPANGLSSVVGQAKAPAATKITSIARKSSTTAHITWKKVSGAKSYEVRVGSKTKKTKSTKMTVKISASTPVKVRAVYRSGSKGKWSASKYVAPMKPGSPSVTAPSASQARIAWKMVTGATAYEVKVGTTSTTLQATSVALLAFAGEHVKVRAKGKGGWGPWSAVTKKPLSSSERTALTNERADLTVLVALTQAEISGLQSDLVVNEYFLSVAVEYGDTLRASVLRASLAQINADILAAQNVINQAQERIKEIDTLLAS